MLLSSNKNHIIQLPNIKMDSTVISAEDDGLFDMKELIKGCPDIIWYGCLDKYIQYKDQKEWRVCWLPEERNFDAGILHVGKLDDIIELIPREKIYIS